jgi:hypothetical protein
LSLGLTSPGKENSDTIQFYFLATKKTQKKRFLTQKNVKTHGNEFFNFLAILMYALVVKQKIIVKTEKWE